MTISSLSAEALEKIRAWQWDRIIEKHEGPEDWASVLHHYDPEFLMISGHPVLLPVGREHHQNITILRTIVSNDSNSLTVFLKDMTHCTSPGEEFYAGYMAVCDRMAGEEFFIAILYHEWFIIENS